MLQQQVTRATQLSLFSPDFATGYVQHFNLNIQREIMRNMVVDVGWVRTKGTKLFSWVDINQPKIQGDFLKAFKDLQRVYASNYTVAAAADNTLVKLFGTPQAAVTAIGSTNLVNGIAGAAAATNVDTNNSGKYAAAGVSQSYLRNFPQFSQVILGENQGRTWYDSLQLSLRRQTGSVKFTVNYTWSKVLDNMSVEGNGFTAPIDNFNLDLNKGRGDYDHPHSLNYTVMWTVPVGHGKRFGSTLPAWANAVVGGWDIGLLGLWQSGWTFSVSSGRRTAGSTLNTWADYTGSRNIGEVTRQGNGVIYFTPEEVARFTFPGAGEIGTSGRNSFRGPRFFNIDTSIVKRFKMPYAEKHSIAFRGELYNLLNNTNFATPGTSLATPQSLGRISNTLGNPRIMQAALRYEF